MKKKLIHSQLTSVRSYQMHKREFITIAKNTFEIANLPKSIDSEYLNNCLLYKGRVAFFYDDIMEQLYALPFNIIGKTDLYNRPIDIVVYGQNGYTRTLKKGEYVIMKDNNIGMSIVPDILQYAERYSLIERTMDCNIYQQRTPRVWRVPQNKGRTFKELLNMVDGFEENIVTYQDKNNPFEDVQCILQPAPYITDKLREEKRQVWSEFLRFVGIADTSYQKKERNIKDEIYMSQGGAIVSRYSRYTPRVEAVEEINELFSDKLEKPLEVRYYDGLPSTKKEDNEVTQNIENEDYYDSDELYNEKEV